MKAFDRHIAHLKGIIAILFLLGNSGFVGLVHSCAMAGTCCNSMAPAHHQTPGNHESGQTVNISRTSCCNEFLVGGLNGASAIIEQGTAQHIYLQIGLHTNCATINCTLQTPGLSSTLSHFSFDSPPRWVEKYVLNTALLI